MNAARSDRLKQFGGSHAPSPNPFLGFWPYAVLVTEHWLLSGCTGVSNKLRRTNIANVSSGVERGLKRSAIHEVLAALM